MNTFDTIKTADESIKELPFGQKMATFFKEKESTVEKL